MQILISDGEQLIMKSIPSVQVERQCEVHLDPRRRNARYCHYGVAAIFDKAFEFVSSSISPA